MTYEQQLAAIEAQLAADRAARAAQVVAQVAGQDVTHGELAEAFKLVQNKEGWKLPICATLDLTADQIALVREAVIYFTGSVPSFQPYGKAGSYRVRAAGYYLTIGG